MPAISPTDIASFAIANAAAGPEVARAFLLQGALGANGPLIAAKLITDQFAALQAEVAASAQNAASLSARAHDHDEIATKLKDATTRLSQSESELATLKQDHAALKAENVAFGDAAAILARQYRMADIDDAQWAAKLKKVRTAMEKSDTDNDALHMMLFVDHPELILDRFLFQMAQDDGTVDPAIVRDFHAVADELRPFTQKLEQRNAAAQQGEYVPAETFTVELALTALGQPVAGGDAPPAAPETPPPPAPAPTPRSPRKSGRTPNRTRK